jgi:glycosyltransferase involved in cell wall biosynthesis
MFPFGTDEQYLNDELKFLARDFKKIFIYPNDYYGSDSMHDKSLPSNVEILHLNLKLPSKANNSLSDYFLLIKATLQELFTTDDKKNYFRNFKWNLIVFWSQLQLAKQFEVYFRNHFKNEDSAIFYSYWFHKSAILLSLLKKRGVVKNFSSRAHSIDLYHNEWGVIDKDCKVPPFKMFKLKNVDQIFTISHHGFHFFKSHFPQYSFKVHNFPLGVSDRMPEMRQRPPGQPFFIVTCSHLSWSKRVVRLVTALTQIDGPIKWVHFGGGPEHEISEINKAALKLNTSTNIELRGYVSNEEVHAFYNVNQIDLFVNLSLVEGIPVSIMEAMHYGIPVLATDVYGTPEAVVDGETGFLIPSDFSDELLASKINYCIDHQTELKKMRLRAREYYLERFSAAKNYTKFANYLSNQ